MRIRTIKPEFWTSESLIGLSDFTLLLAIGLLNYSDDDGYFNANTALIRASLFPLRDECSTSTVQVRDLSGSITVAIRELSSRGYLKLYKCDGGRIYGCVVSFKIHQVINKHKPSKIKHLCVSENELRYDYGTSTVLVPSGTGNREQGSGTGNMTCAEGRVVEVLKSEIDDSKAKPEKKARERNQLLDAMATVGGGKPEEVTPKAWPAAASALSEIKSVSPDVTVEEIRRRAENYKKHFRDAALTPSALARHWARCGDWLKQSGHTTPDDILNAF